MKRTFFLLTVSVLLLPLGAHARHSDTQDVFDIASGEVVGTSTLKRDSASIRAAVKTKLIPGDAYTLWAVIFNYPKYCKTSPCSAADLAIVTAPDVPTGDPRVQSSLVLMTGQVASDNPHMVGRLYRAPFRQTGRDTPYGPGLISPRGAEVHLVVRTHGAAIPERQFEQIWSFAGGCDTNKCADVQAAIHLPRWLR